MPCSIKGIGHDLQSTSHYLFVEGFLVANEKNRQNSGPHDILWMNYFIIHIGMVTLTFVPKIFAVCFIATTKFQFVIFH